MSKRKTVKVLRLEGRARERLPAAAERDHVQE